MAVEAFIKLGDLKGESVVKGFENQIQVLSWRWSMSQTGTTHHGTGGGAGKVNVSDLGFTHYVDSASPNLVKAVCKGEHFQEAKLTLRKAGGSPLEYYVITMKKVMVTSVEVGGTDGDERVSENISLNFGEFEVSYQPQDEKGGKKGGAISAKYDIAGNK